MATYRFVVSPEKAALRLDRYLAQQMPASYSRARVQRAIREGQVTINGAVANAHRRLKSGERIVAHLQEVSDTPPAAACGRGVRHFLAEPIPLDIVHEDHDVLVVNKPPGLVTHPAPGHPSGTLVNAVAWHLKQVQGSRFKVQGSSLEPRAMNLERSSPEPRTSNLEPLLPRAGIVHRLDQDTSGLLVVAKTETALRELGKQLRERTMSRRYLALVEGHVPLDEGTINVGVGRHLTRRKEMAVRYLGGRHAVTHYRVLKRFTVHGSRLKGKDQDLEPRTSNLERGSFRYSFLEVRLETGRTHQIRVHMSHLGHPVLGDPVYSRRPAAFWQAQGIRRQLLHACAIRFVHPATRQPVELRSDLPKDMLRWIEPADADSS